MNGPSEPQCITDPLRDFAERQPDRPFARQADRCVSYGDMWAEINRVAGGLAALGVGAGSRVGIMLDNDIDFLVTWFALARLGAVEVPVNTAFHGTSLSYVLGHSGSTAVVVEEHYLDRLDAVRRDLAPLPAVVVHGGPARGAGATAWAALEGPVPGVRVRTTDPVAVLYTSGTTGRSKGVCLPHRYYLKMAEANARAVRLTADDVYYTCLPLFHGMAQLSGTMGPLCAGAQVVIAPRFSVSRFWQDCREQGVTGFGAIAAMTSLLYKQPPTPQDREHQVRFGFAVAVPRSIEAAFEQRFGVRLINGYGMTEAGQMTYTPYDAPRPGSCGLPVDLYQLEIHDARDRPVPVGTVGEIVVRPTTYAVTMLGYHGMPEETVQAWQNLWLHTGDLARRDEDGYLYFVDRDKDCIRRRGENISSLEVEAALLKHPGVAEAAAFPVPSDLGEDEVMAAVVLADPATPAADLFRHCAGELPRFAVPAYIRVMDALPKTPTQKVRKHQLRAEGRTPGTASAGTPGEGH